MEICFFYGIGKRKKLAIFVESLLSLRTRHLKNVANEVYVLNAGQSLVQHVVVADVSDKFFRFERRGFEVYSVYKHFAFFKRDNTGYALDRRGFSRAVRAYKAEYFTVVYGERQIVHRRFLIAGISFGQIFDL